MLCILYVRRSLEHLPIFILSLNTVTLLLAERKCLILAWSSWRSRPECSSGWEKRSSATGTSAHSASPFYVYFLGGPLEYNIFVIVTLYWKCIKKKSGSERYKNIRIWIHNTVFNTVVLHVVVRASLGQSQIRSLAVVSAFFIHFFCSFNSVYMCEILSKNWKKL